MGKNRIWLNFLRKIVKNRRYYAISADFIIFGKKTKISLQKSIKT